MKKALLLGILGGIALLSPPAVALQAHKLAAGERIVLDGNLDEAVW